MRPLPLQPLESDPDLAQSAPELVALDQWSRQRDMRQSGAVPKTLAPEAARPTDSDETSTLELLALSQRDLPMSVGRASKRILDVLGALFLAALFSPLIIGIFLATRRSSTPVLFRHKRVGRNGEVFDCLKFRTMVPNAEQVLQDLLASNPAMRDEWSRDHKLRDDPRVTGLGKFLRSTSLDELPQIWNVLKGEMSLVGPRPVTREETLRYGRNIVLYTMAKPGITGLWQVSGRSNTDYRRRVAIDVCYVRNQSMLLDIWILLKTTTVVVGRHGAY